MVAFASPGVVAAQPADPPAASGADGGKTGAAGDIVVTARRTSERLQDVPVAVTAVSEAKVRTLNLSDSRDLVRVAPALGFTQGVTTKLVNFTVRGVGTFVNSDGLDQSVGVAFDGISLARPGGSIADLVDIERVEVLEGPQGMLFGRNASAGLVNIISRKPELGRTGASGRLGYGSYDEFKFDTALNLAAGDSFAARLAIWKFRHDGYVDAVSRNRKIGEKDSEGARLRLRWEPTAELAVNLMAERTEADQDPAVTTLRVFTNNNFGVRDYELARGIVPDASNQRTSSDKIIFNKGHTNSFSSDVGYDLGSATVTLLGSYREVSVLDKYDPAATSSPIYISSQTDDLDYNQKSIELRVNSDSSQRLRYVFGGIFFDARIHDSINPNSAGTTPTFFSVLTRTNEVSKHYAAFGELTYALTPQINVIAGGRFSRDRIHADLNRTYATPPAVIIATFNGPGATFGPYATQSSVRDHEFSYRGGLQWKPGQDVMLYTTVSRGYKAAGLDLAATVTPTIFAVNQLRVDPEIVMNYEAGLRTQFFDRRVTFNATVFQEVFKDFQTSVRLPVLAAVFSVTNAKQLKSTGVTAQLEARIVDGLTLSDSAAYIHARYTNFNNAACYPGQTAALGCVGGVQSLNGKPLQNAPRVRNDVTLRYERAGIGADLRAFGQVNVRSQSREVFNAVADPFERQGGFSLVNLAAGFGAEDGIWQISFYGSNIFDKKFVARTVVQNAGSYYANVVPYEARARWGGAVEFKF